MSSPETPAHFPNPTAFAHARAVRDHEVRVAQGYPAALAQEPGLRRGEWAGRNPFVAGEGVRDGE